MSADQPKNHIPKIEHFLFLNCFIYHSQPGLLFEVYHQKLTISLSETKWNLGTNGNPPQPPRVNIFFSKIRKKKHFSYK